MKINKKDLIDLVETSGKLRIDIMRLTKFTSMEGLDLANAAIDKTTRIIRLLENVEFPGMWKENEIPVVEES